MMLQKVDVARKCRLIDGERTLECLRLASPLRHPTTGLDVSQLMCM